jgi:outer membrane protein assembly factor BamB
MPRRFSAALVCLISGTVALAGSWPNWRGPAFNGVASGTGYPTRWSKTDNVAWKFDLPGKGASTPVASGDRIVLTCGIDGQNGVLCLGWDGKPLWQKTIGSEKPGKHNKATGCNPSAVTDGKRWYVYFKSGDLACLDSAGTILWQHNLQKLYGADTLWWDLGTSPVLTKDFVVVAVMHSGPSPSYLAAFDKTTGNEAWKRDRNLGAPSEAAQSYSTPVVVNDNGQEILVVLGADHVTAHSASDGAELWRVGGLNPQGQQFFRSIASPVVEDGIVVAPYARGRTLTAIRLGGKGDVTGSHVLWTKDGLGADVPTPAALDGRVYVCTDRGGLSCLDVHSGDILWEGQAEKNRNAFSASPVIADGKVYITREDGKIFILELGKEFKLIGSNALDGEFVVATPVFVDGRILIRTAERLYCIGK